MAKKIIMKIEKSNQLLEGLILHQKRKRKERKWKKIMYINKLNIINILLIDLNRP